MFKRIIASILISAFNVAFYLEANKIATVERGCSAMGGEEMLLVFGIFLAIYVMAGGFEKKEKRQSEQDCRKSNRKRAKQEQSL